VLGKRSDLIHIYDAVLIYPSKSQIAIHYAHQIRQSYPDTRVFWVYASTRPRFEEAYRTIARTLQLPGLNDPNIDVLSLVRDWLSNERNGNWLIILDNADDVGTFYAKSRCPGRGITSAQVDGILVPTGISDESPPSAPPLALFLPKTPNGKILITSRSIDAAEHLVGSHKNIFRVPVMNGNQATELFRNKLAYLGNEAGMPDLLRALDFLPLAISQAAAYINRRPYRMTIAAYLDEFRKSQQKGSVLLSKDVGDLRRDDSASNAVVTTWNITFGQIRADRPSAAKLLSFMSFFSPHEIPEFILQAYSEDTDLHEDLDILCGYSLVSHAAQLGAWEMHSLVQLCIKVWLSSSGEISTWKRIFLETISDNFPPGYFESWTVCQVLYPHIEPLVQETPPDDELESWARLLANSALYMDTIGNYKMAEYMGRKALVARKQVLGEEHPNTLTSMNNLASVLESQGKYDDAGKLHREALEIRKTVLGEEHPSTLTSMNNLASVLERQGKYDDAEKLHREEWQLSKTALGEEHPSTLTSMNNLASVLERQGKYDDAEKLHREEWQLSKKVLGEEHPSTLTSMNNLALVLESQGIYDDAEKLHREALEISKKVLGEEHPNTLTSMNNLASVLESQGKYDDAEKLHREALEISKKVLGEEHPSTLTSMNNLASVLESQGKYDDAEKLHRETLEISKKVLGEEHPNTLTSMNNLALVLGSQGKYDDAEKLHRETLEISKTVLGEEHLNTLTSMNNLALVLKSQGKYDDAEKLYREVLEISKTVLGEEHPNTLTSMNNLRRCLGAKENTTMPRS